MEYKAGDGTFRGPEDWKHLSGTYTLNNGFFGWVDNEGDLYSIRIPKNEVFRDRVLNYLGSNFERNDSVPVISY